MEKQSNVQKFTRSTRSWITVGMLMSLTIIGVVGCGSQKATTAPSTATTQSSSTTEASADSETQPTTSSQDNQGQTAQKPTLNPAIEAAMGIRRLQGNQQMVLTSDQKDKIKPILQLLIDTSDPSQDFLQEKADAITAVFTDQQKTYLSTNAKQGDLNQGPNGDSQNGQEPSSEQPKDQPKGQNGVPNGKASPSGQPQDIFKQVLASLT
ncbi:hypothetical protein [Desulfosporosinus sp. OT]|uniref:hypothetical protein n=1 Tax=Desulfosporosinus sp. OT TaxID=913865 RepID=UPI000223AF98|nr:hypothetical protein [Desulfosporosinus sp. OT]EGW36818.1 putative lipoprotein [Desulfosporosinus sp. OT]